MNEEIRNILNGIKNEEKVLEYIEELEKHLEHHHNCHDDNCNCGCDDEEENWEEIKTSYKNKLTVKDWENLLKNPEIFTIDSLKLMKRMRHIAAPTSVMELADMFGFGAIYYKTEAQKLEQRIIKQLNLTNIEKENNWAIIFDCWKNKQSEEQIYALCPELYEAIGNIDLSNISLRENDI